MKLPDWIIADSQRLERMIERDQLPHALLVHGPVGVGRRALAFWLAARLLGPAARVIDSIPLGSGRIDDEQLPGHPDFRLLQPLEDKKSISIEQVRELIGFLDLTSHQSGAKVALISPAQLMNHHTANCLLKTLEEPTARSYLILVAESLSRLPATIVSRCHQIRVPLPGRQEAVQWLQDIDQHIDWTPALDLSGGAPLTAARLQRLEFPQLAKKLEQDLRALRQRKETPVSIARSWGKNDEWELCLLWLFNRLSGEIRTKIEQRVAEDAENSRNRRLQKRTETLNMEPSFAVLRQIGEMRRLQGTGLNQELLLTDVLTRWTTDF